MAVNDVYRAEVFQNVGSELTMNVLHFREVTEETVLANPAEAVCAAAHAIYLGVVDNMSEDWRVTQITARKVSGTPGVPFTRVLGAADAVEGTVVSEIVPSQTALLVSFYSSNALRTGRGRMYLPGIPENAQNEGQMLEAAVTNFQTWADAFFVDVLGPFLTGDSTWWLTIFGPTTTPSPVQDVIQATVRSNLATQRRRRNFPGFGG